MVIFHIHPSYKQVLSTLEMVLYYEESFQLYSKYYIF